MGVPLKAEGKGLGSAFKMLTVYVALRFSSRERPELFNSKFVTGVEILRTGPAGLWLA